MDTAAVIQDLIIGIGLISGILLYLKGHVPQQTIKNLKESNDSLIGLNATREAEIKKLAKEVHENNATHAEEVLKLNKEISSLTGELRVWRELPIKKLADGMDAIVKVTQENALSNQKILETLQSSAATLATEKHDGGLLVKTKDGTPLQVSM